MATKAKNKKTRSEPKTRLASETQRVLLTTGLSDYGYWWRLLHEQPSPEATKPFRRGRIWR
jgi:cyanobactin cluster PatC/TenC/TruC protein